MAQSVQSDINPVGFTGTQLADWINDFKASELSNHSGTTRPAYLPVNGVWVDTTNTNPLLKFYDGTDDIVICELDVSTNKITLSDFYTKTESDGRYLQISNDLSDLNDLITARTNLSVYSKAEVDNLFTLGTSGGSHTQAMTGDYNINPSNGLMQVLQPNADNYTAYLPLGSNEGINVIVFNDSEFELFVESVETTVVNSTVKILPKGKVAFGWSGTEWVSHKYVDTGKTLGEAIKEFKNVDNSSLDNVMSYQGGLDDRYALITAGNHNIGDLAFTADVLIGKINVANNQSDFALNSILQAGEYIVKNDLKTNKLITKLTDDKVLLHYAHTDINTAITGHKTAIATIGGVNDNELTIGAYTDLTSEVIGEKAIRISDTKFMYFNTSKILVATESLSAITLGASQNEVSVADYISIDTDKIIKASATGISLGTISGTTVSFGTETALTGIEQLYTVDTDKFVAVYDDLGTKNIIVGLISGTNILTGTSHTLASTFEDLVVLGPTRFVVRHTTSTIENFGIGGTSISSVASSVLPLPTLLGNDLDIYMENVDIDTLILSAPKSPITGRYSITDASVYVIKADATTLEIREAIRKSPIDSSNSISDASPVLRLPIGTVSPTTKSRIFICSDYYDIPTSNVGEITE